MDTILGQTIDRYHIQDLIDVGRSWNVYLAYDPKFQRHVAVKLLKAPLAEQADAQESLLLSARNAIRLRHPGLARIFDLGQSGKMFYLVEEYIPGRDLGHLMAEMRRNNLQVGLVEASLIACELASALDYIWERGFKTPGFHIHDVMLKPYKEGDRIPSETLALPYQPVIVDLGLAMEAAGGAENGQSNDLYGLLTILYELATGLPPSEGKKAPPAPLRNLMRRAFSTEPELRFSSAGEFAQKLRELLPELQALDPTPLNSDTVTPLLAVHQQIVAAIPLLTPIEPLSSKNEADLPISPGLKGEIRLRVLDPDHSVRIYPLTRSSLIVGRSKDCDILVQQTNVSRQHAQILFDGNQVRISDLGSANGTFLGEQRLLANVPQLWSPGEIVKIGDSIFQIELIGSDAQEKTAAIEAGRSTTPAFEMKEGVISLALEQASFVVAPGESVQTSVIITNQGLLDDVFDISISGLPERWFSLSQERVQLGAGSQAVLRLELRIPRSSDAKAGRRAFTIKVRSRSPQAKILEARVNLTIRPYTAIHWEVHPSEILAGQPFAVAIENLGNIPETCELRCEDPQKNLVINPPSTRTMLPPGEKTTVRFVPVPQNIRLFGGTRPNALIIHFNSSSRKAETKTIQVFQPAIFPSWALLGFLGIAFFMILVGVMFFGGIVLNRLSESRATHTAETALAGMVQGTEQARLATEQFLAGANDATIQAVTATVLWLDGDEDRDGLSNRDELERGTNPGERDTDLDGVSDGEEVERGLNPLQSDSDGDGIKDGDEILRGLNPLDRDTDKDGIVDGIDSDPGKAPTATTTPTLIASFTPTTTMTITPTSSATLTPTSTSTQLVNPLPSISGLSPNTKVIGSGAFLLTVSGAGFINGSQVRWNGSPRNTTFQNANTLLVQIPASDLSVAGSFEITVSNPSPGGGISSPRNFLVANPAPVVNALNPNQKAVYDGQFTLQVFGSQFLTSSKVFWGSLPRTTTFISSNELSVLIPATDLLAAGTISVSVVNPSPGGGSAAVSFVINNPIPSVAEIQPNQATVSGTSLTIELTGTNFVSSSIVVWDENNVETNLETTFIDRQTLSAVIPGSLLSQEKHNIKITVFNGAPGGGESNFIFFDVLPASLLVSLLYPK